MVRSSRSVWIAGVIVAAGIPGTLRAEPTSRPVPETFYMSAQVRPLVEKMWQRSPSFRSQVDRIVDANVRVVLQVVSPLELGSATATATIIREGGAVKYVRIRLRAATDWAPAIAHELEHVLEALEGIDLPSLAGHRGDVWQVDRGRYESARARDAGHRIAAEYHRGGDATLSAQLLPEAAPAKH